MKIIITILQYFTGALLLVMGVNKFVGFISMPTPEGDMAVYMQGLAASGFVFPIVGISEMLTGASFLLNKYTSLTTVIFFPIAVNILLTHLVLDPAGGMMAYMVFIAICLMVWKNREQYRPLFHK